MRDVAVLPMLKKIVKANSLPTLAHSKLVKEFFAEKNPTIEACLLLLKDKICPKRSGTP